MYRNSQSSVNYDCKMQRFKSVQNTIAMVVDQACKYDHVTLILSHLYWLSVTGRILFKVLIIGNKYMHKMVPIYLTD